MGTAEKVLWITPSRTPPPPEASLQREHNAPIPQDRALARHPGRSTTRFAQGAGQTFSVIWGASKTHFSLLMPGVTVEI